MGDLDLLHYYTTSDLTPTSGNDEYPVVWQTVAAKLAMDHPFLMHGMLATSAIHLSRLFPERQEEHAILAANHMNLALPFLLPEAMNITEQNSSAIFAFSALVAFYATAAPHPPGGLLFPGTRRPDETPDRLNLITGTLAIGSSAWQEMALSLMTTSPDHRLQLDGPGNPNSATPLQSLFNLHLVALHSLYSDSMSSTPDQVHEYSIYLTALRGLQENFSVPVSPVKVPPHQWVTKIPHEYITFLRERRPGALVLLAYLCVLLKKAESDWRMDGLAQQLMAAIVKNLPSCWDCWIQWPLNQVGYVDNKSSNRRDSGKEMGNG